MGGKTKQSQRTKNNARPSSSSRSAELLHSGNLDSGLITLGIGKPLPVFPTFAVTANLDQGIKPEFQICFKKLNKKDPITRAKALQELSELVNKGDVDDVVAALPSWAHFYKILTTDTDRKVRELTQMCHGAIVRVCGRRCAPQLKALVPAWLQAQHDDHAPAMTYAQLSLTSTFPDSKLPEVISFCKAEIMAHLHDNLIGNAETIISKRVEEPEERSLHQSRVVSSSLQGLQYLSRHLPPLHSAWLWEHLADILHAAAFWNYANSTPQIRAAWYGAVGALVERYGRTFWCEFGTKTSRLLLEAARRRDAAAPQLWGCLLLAMHNVQDWHKYVDKQELLIKRILDVLENGGWGDARHLLNMLLPLLAHLPHDILTKHFYEKFFSAMFIGLEKKNVLNSKSERQSWITSLAECLRYLSIQQGEFVLEVSTGVHRTWLESVLSVAHDGHTRTNLIKCSATNMASLVKYWLKQSKEGNSEKYDQLVRNFWQNVGSTVLTQIDKSGVDLDEIGKIIDGHILLLQTLKSSFGQEARKQQSIKFDDDEQTTPDKCTAEIEECDVSIAERYKHNLEDIVQKVCCHYFESSEKKQVSNTILTPLYSLLVEFDSKELFVSIARQFGADSVYKLYEIVLRTWLNGDTMRCKVIVDIIFLMMKYMTEEEQDSMFSTFDQFPPACVEWCLCVGVRHPFVSWRSVRRWARGPAVGATVRALCVRAATHGDARAAHLLHACLADTPHGEPLMSEASISEVVNCVCNAVRDPHSSALEAGCTLAARLSVTLQERAHLPCYLQLLHALFALNIQVPRGDARLSVETWREVRSSWQDGLGALSHEQRDSFLTDVAAFLKQLLLQNMEDLMISKIENIVSPCPHLFSGSGDVRCVVSFTKLLVERCDDVTVGAAALRHLCVTSRLNCLYEHHNAHIAAVIQHDAHDDGKELTKTELMPYLNNNLLRAIYLRNLLLHKIDSDDEEQETREDTTWCDELLKDEYIQEEFCEMLHNYAVINSLYEGFAFCGYYDSIVLAKHALDSVVEHIVLASSDVTRVRVCSALSVRGATLGYYWALALHHYESVAMTTTPHEAPHTLTPHDVVSGDGLIHTLQASALCSNDEEVRYKMKYIVMLRSWHVAYGLALDAALLRPEHDHVETVINAYYNNNHTMLYDKDVSGAAWSAVVCNAAVCECLSGLVTSQGWAAPPHHWDFVNITLCSLLHSVHCTKLRWGCTKAAMLTRSVLRLYVSVHKFVSSIRSESERREPPAHIVDLLNEWKDIFAPDTQNNLFSFILHVLDSCTDSEMTSAQIEVLGALLECTPHLQWEALPAARRAHGAALCLPRVLQSATDVLQHTAHRAYKHLAYYVLTALSEPLVLDDAEKLSLWSDDSLGDGDEEKERPQFSLDLFHEAFTHLHDIVDAALSGVVLGEETCELVLYSDSYSMALGWLLLADVLAKLAALARGDLTHHYVTIFKERGYPCRLLSCSLRLLPPHVFSFARDTTHNAPPPNAQHLFLGLQPFSIYDGGSGGDVSALACRSIYTIVCGAGAASARGWAAAAPPRAGRVLRRLVTQYVSPHAAKEHLLNLHHRANELEDTEIRIAWSTHEVTCLYSVEDRQIELRVWLSRDHPLTPPRLAAPDAAGPGANTHWVALYLAYQNGTLLNALKMWTRAVSARVESSPQCYICYCRLHPSTGRLPRVLCHQCKNKFHNICLRKWFTTSNKSNCPLCRSTF